MINTKCILCDNEFQQKTGKGRRRIYCEIHSPSILRTIINNHRINPQKRHYSKITITQKQYYTLRNYIIDSLQKYINKQIQGDIQLIDYSKRMYYLEERIKVLENKNDS
jgi:hypothetical protein